MRIISVNYDKKAILLTFYDNPDDMMKQIALHFPVLVTHDDLNGKRYFNIRPLFSDFPQYTHRRYEDGLRHFEQAVRKKFKDFILTRDNAAELNWFLFQPEITFLNLPITVSLNKNYPELLFHVCIFEWKGYRIGCLPMLGHFMFFVSESEWSDISILKLKTGKIVTRLVREYKHETGEDFDIELLQASKLDFVAWCDMKISVGYGAFEFEESVDNSIYDRLFGGSDFRGEDELYQIGYALDDLYPAGLQPAFYRDEFVDRLYRMLYEKEYFSFVIVGEQGVGKHSVLQEAVRRYRDALQNTPDKRGMKLWIIDPGRIISGMSIIGQWQQRMEAIIEYIRQPEPFESNTSDILVFENPVALTKIGRSAQNTHSVGDVLKHYIEKRQLRTVLIATPDEWKLFQEKDRRIADLFQVLRLEPTDLITAYKIAFLQRRYIESGSDATISVLAIDYLFFLKRLFYRSSALPGGVIGLMNQLTTRYKTGMIDLEEVRDTFKSLSGMKDRLIDEEALLDHTALLAEISRKIIGQPEAATALADIIHQIKARLTDNSKPFASLLLVGPTGVGKSQAAKVMAEMMMGDEEHLIRFDMNEYIDFFAVERLIGTFEQPEGLLTGRVRYQPFGVILFDEIEKAHPKVLDVLLQVLDDARLTDSTGKTVDFSNLVIIMTSNVGSEKVSRKLGFNTAGSSSDALYKKAIEQQFRPEFVNRIDKIVIFQSLRVQHILEIARLQIRELLNRDGFVRRSTIINITPEALEWVAKRGFDPLMGGRALKRQIEHDLTVLSARQLLRVPGDRPIVLSIELREDQLFPNMTVLQVTSTGPFIIDDKVLTEKQLRINLYKLLEEADHLQHQVDTVYKQQMADPSHWSYFDLKEKITTFREWIRELILRVSDSGGAFVDMEVLRFKKPGGPAPNLRISSEQVSWDRTLQYWRDTFNYQNILLTPEQSGILELRIQLRFLQSFVSGIMNGQADEIVINFKSKVQGMGDEQVDHLMSAYKILLEDMDIHYIFEKEKRQILATGYGIMEVFSRDAGIHIFYSTGTTPVPISVGVRMVNAGIETNENATILRIFDTPQSVIDLRSGLIGRYDLKPEEWKVFLFAAMTF